MLVRTLLLGAFLTTLGCAPEDIGPIGVTVMQADVPGNVSISWSVPAPRSDQITELRLFQCDQDQCPADREAALASKTPIWRVSVQDVDETQVPLLEGPIVYPGGVADIELWNLGELDPLTPPPLEAGETYVAVAWVNADTMLVQQKGSGLAEFTMP